MLTDRLTLFERVMNKHETNFQAAGVICEHGPKNWQTNDKGLLAGTRLAVKDVFAVQSEKNSAGNPDWFNNAKAAEKTASSVNNLMNAGCNFVGFTHTDELAYSLEGNNLHYGAAENPKVKGHACGGSSMGSAAAVAAGIADIGLGTDTGGSIRIPASYCGLFGIRPSHDVIATDGLVPLAQPFDTIGWFTQSAQLLQDTGYTLLPEQTENKVDTLIVADALFELVSPDLAKLLELHLKQVKTQFEHHRQLKLPNKILLSQLADAFRILQGRAIAKQHGDWIKQTQPKFAPAIAARFKMAMALTAEEEAVATKIRQEWQQVIADNLDPTSCLFLPTTPTTAPKLAADTTELRMQILTLSAIAGLSRSVQVHIPTLESEQGHPYGFSLMMAHGNDRSLLKKVTELASHLNEE